MSFFVGIDKVFHYIRYGMDSSINMSTTNEVNVPAPANVKPKILDNTKIQGIKSARSESCIIFVGVMFVASIVAYVAYGQVSVSMDGLSSVSSVQRDMEQLRTSGTDMANVIHTDISIDDTVMGSLSPISYLLYIAPKESLTTYDAAVIIRIKCIRDTSNISLHSLHHHVEKVAITAINKSDDSNIVVTKYSEVHHFLVLSLNTKLLAGHEYNLSIGFHGDITEESKGMFVKKYQDGDGVIRQILSGVFQFGRARHVFPCFDEPSYKASFQIILRHDESFSAISNMPVEKTVISSGLVDTYFKKSPPMSPDHISFVIAEYTYQEIIVRTGLKIRLYAPKGRVSETSTAGKMIPSIIQYYEKMFGVMYVVQKLDIVPVDMLSLHTSVSPGLIVIPEYILLLSENVKTLIQMELSAYTLGRVLMKQLLGSLVTLDAGDVWFTESMVLYIGYQAAKYLYPSWDVESQFYLDITNKALVEDASRFTEPVHISISEGLHHYDEKRHALKGAALWNMISQYVGTSTFLKNIILSWNGDMKQHKINTGNILDILTKNIPQHDIAVMLKSWFLHRGFPLVRVYPDVDAGQYIFEQKHFIEEKLATDRENLYNWHIPIFVRSMCDPTTTTRLVMNKGRELFNLHNCYLHKVNSGGFFRVNYGKTDARNFIKLLNTNHTVLTAVDRASLIADVFEIARFNPQTILTALHFTTYLSNEHHYVPYKIALTQLREIPNLYNDTQIEKYVQKYIQKKTQPVLLYLGSLKKHDHMQKKLIGLLMREAVTYDLYIAVYLHNMFLHWMISKSSIQPPHHLRELMFEVGIWRGSKYEWNYLYRYFQKIPSNAEKDLVLNGLAVTKNKLYLKQLIDYASKCNSSSISCIQQTLKIWTKVCANKNGGRQLVTDNFFRNRKSVFTNLEETFEDLETFMLNCLGYGKTMADKMQVKTIDVGSVSPPLKTLLEKVIECIEQRINLTKSKEYVGNWFMNKSRQLI